MNEPIDIRLDETLLCGELQDCDSVDRWNSKTTRSRAAVQVVHQDSVRSTVQGPVAMLPFHLYASRALAEVVSREQAQATDAEK